MSRTLKRPMKVTVRTGLDALLERPSEFVAGERVGLIVHQASVRGDLRRTDALLLANPSVNVCALFGPQHGVYGEKQDDMIESASFTHPTAGIPVYSLYGDVRKPTPEMLDGIDVLLFDLQDVGVRVYTFLWTMTLAMEACRDAGVRFIVLDRPNPIGGVVREGHVLNPAFRSFVGGYPIPLRHGMTAGEIARMANETFSIGCELEVVPCTGWRRGAWFDQTGLPFVMPSPNLPTLDSCTAYPGMVLIEGTNLSEGRGTTRPFELMGAPYLDPDPLEHRLNGLGLPGVVFRACSFEPTFQKHAGKVCGGVQLHVTERDLFEPVRTAVRLLSVVRDLAPGDFAWRQPPYEYEHETMPIDLLWGDDTLRAAIDRGEAGEDLVTDTIGARQDFHSLAVPFHLYEE